MKRYQVFAMALAVVGAMMSPSFYSQQDPEVMRLLRLARADLAQARTAIDSAEARLVEIAKLPSPDGGEGEVEPPPVDTGAPDFSEAPFAALMPQFPSYRVPTLQDCDWTISGGVATSTRGLPSIPADDDGGVIGHAYRASIAAGHELPITVGVWDNGGPAYVGGIYWPSSGRSITSKRGDTFSPLSIEIVGLDEQCEVQTCWGGEWGWTEYVGYFNIGFRGAQDSFNIRANNRCGKVVIDGCWFLPAPPNAMQDAAIHCANWETMVLRRVRARGERPADPPPLYRQHNFYFKNTGPGGLFIVENQFQGSNGTCFQIRPGTDEVDLSRPAGPVVIAYNRSNGYGWEHGNTPATEHGGSAISVWSSPDFPVFVYRNEILDARYGCFLVSQQSVSPTHHKDYTYRDLDGNWETPPTLVVFDRIVQGGGGPGSSHPPETWIDRNWYGAEGHPVQNVYLAENTFSNPRSARGAVSVTAAREVHVWGTNRLLGGATWTLDSQWAAQNGFTDVKNGVVRLYGSPMQGENFWTFDGQVTRRMTAEEVQSMRVLPR